MRQQGAIRNCRREKEEENGRKNNSVKRDGVQNKKAPLSASERPVGKKPFGMAEKEDDKNKLTVRLGVTHKKQKVFDLRCWHDDYTNLPYDKLVDKAPQVDHVVEVQLLNKAWNGAPPAARTREGHKQFANVIRVLYSKVWYCTTVFAPFRRATIWAT